MKEFRPVPLDKCPDLVGELDRQIRDVSIYVQLIAQGSYPGVHSEYITKLKTFLLDIRDQLISSYDSQSFVIAHRKEQEENQALASSKVAEQ